MLDLKENRITYKQLLSLDDSNYKIKRILTTSYSLDIKALIGICLALELDEEAVEENDKNFPTLHVFSKLSKKLVIICQNGTISCPKDIKKLGALFENTIYTATLNGKNFHPKFWLIKYEHKENKNIKYKLIVASKNLTFDRSWDMQINMEGDLKSNVHGQNGNIIEFLKHVKNVVNVPETKKEHLNEIIDELIKDLPGVEFNTSLNKIPVEKCEFIQFGKNTNNKIEYFEKNEKKIQDALIVSPFIDSQIIKSLIDNTEKQVILITRRSELYKIKSLVDEKLKVLVINKRIYDGEENIEEENFKPQNQDIHAKMFLFKDSKKTYLYIGSANATHSAFYGNTETMIKTTATDSNLFNVIKRDLLNVETIDGEERRCFIEPELDDFQNGESTEEQEFKKFVRNFFELTPNATITGEYTISINYDKLITNPNYIVKIKPLLYEGKSEEISDKPIIFKKLELKDLSEFYIVEFNGPEVISKMIKIPTRNIPELDTRISAIASTMFKNQDDFLRYLSFILSDDYLSILLDENYKKNSRKSQIFNNNYMPAIYEEMLKTVAKNPERLNEIDDLLTFTEKNSNIRPEGFEELYNKFKEAVLK